MKGIRKLRGIKEPKTHTRLSKTTGGSRSQEQAERAQDAVTGGTFSQPDPVDLSDLSAAERRAIFAKLRDRTSGKAPPRGAARETKAARKRPRR